MGIWAKVLFYLELLVPAVVIAFFQGLKWGRRETDALQRKFLNETLKAELEKNAEIIKRDFSDLPPDAAVRKVIGPDKK